MAQASQIKHAINHLLVAGAIKYQGNWPIHDLPPTTNTFKLTDIPESDYAFLRSVHKAKLRSVRSQSLSATWMTCSVFVISWTLIPQHWAAILVAYLFLIGYTLIESLCIRSDS